MALQCIHHGFQCRMSTKLSEKNIRFPQVYGLDCPICLPAIFYLRVNLKGEVYSNNPHNILKSWKWTFTMRLWKSHQMNWQMLPETCWNVLSCVFKLMVNSFSTSCELLNVLQVALNINNVSYCTILYSVFTMNVWMSCMLLLKRGLFYVGHPVCVPVTTAWRFLRLRTEVMASRYGAKLKVWWISSHGQAINMWSCSLGVGQRTNNLAPQKWSLPWNP